jgi:hypothetical protein
VDAVRNADAILRAIKAGQFTMKFPTDRGSLFGRVWGP